MQLIFLLAGSETENVSRSAVAHEEASDECMTAEEAYNECLEDVDCDRQGYLCRMDNCGVRFVCIRGPASPPTLGKVMFSIVSLQPNRLY